LFDHHTRRRRRRRREGGREGGRQRVERKNSSIAEIGACQKASALLLILTIYCRGCGKPLKILHIITCLLAEI
jgi:hypothetical protein